MSKNPNTERNLQFLLHDRNKDVIQQSLKDHLELLGPGLVALALQEVQAFQIFANGGMKLRIHRSGTPHAVRLVIDIENGGPAAKEDQDAATARKSR